MADSPGKVLADGETQVERYLEAEGLTKDEIGEAMELAINTDSYVIVGNRPDALYFEYGDFRIEEGGEYMDGDGEWDEG
jgi:hypothetical protein